MELLQFTEQARCAIHALTKAIEGLNSKRRPRIIECLTADNENVSVMASEIAAIRMDRSDAKRCLYVLKSGSTALVKGTYSEAVKIWKEALENG